MADSLKASEEGRQKVEQLRREKGWLAADPKWCEMAYTSPKTLTRFRRGERIRRDTFVSICQAIGAHWEDVVDRGAAAPAEPIIWEVKVEADDALKTAIFELLKKHTGDANLSIRKIEKGSLIFVLEGSLEGFERMEYLYHQGLLTELAGTSILDVQRKKMPVRLREWWQGTFGDLWQSPPALAFARRLSMDEDREGEDNNTISRAKTMRLGNQTTDPTVQLIVQLTEQEQGVPVITLQVYPEQANVYLPVGLQLTVMDLAGNVYETIESMEQNNYMQLEIIGEPEEVFRVRLQLNDCIIVEDFVV